MICDFQREAGLESLECDVCVVGGGAAGLSIAKEFDGGPPLGRAPRKRRPLG